MGRNRDSEGWIRRISSQTLLCSPTWVKSSWLKKICFPPLSPVLYCSVDCSPPELGLKNQENFWNQFQNGNRSSLLPFHFLSLYAPGARRYGGKNNYFTLAFCAVSEVQDQCSLGPVAQASTADSNRKLELKYRSSVSSDWRKVVCLGKVCFFPL